MDFHLTREQELVRQMMHDFTENEVKPIAAETDKTSTYPRENIEKLFDLGVMGMVVPEEFGGAGAVSYTHLTLPTCPPLSLSRSCPSSALPPAISSLPTMVCAAARSLQTVLPHRRRSTSAC